MHDFSCKNPDDMKYKVLAERASYLKQDKKREANMSKLMEELIEEERMEIAEEMLKDGTLYFDKIARYLQFPIEKVQKLASRL